MSLHKEAKVFFKFNFSICRKIYQIHKCIMGMVSSLYKISQQARD